MIYVDKISSSSIDMVITLGLAIGLSKPLFGGGAFGSVGLPGLMSNVLYLVPLINGWWVWPIINIWISLSLKNSSRLFGCSWITPILYFPTDILMNFSKLDSVSLCPLTALVGAMVLR